jgi:drug/metabolite transporter (DMT)-like permease
MAGSRTMAVEQPSTSQARATLLVLFSASCFGSIPILVTLGTRSGAALIDLLLWRYALAAVMLIVVSGGIEAILRPGRRALTVLVLAGSGQALLNIVNLSALRYIPVATLTFLFYTYPAWVALISAIRGSERLTGRRALALLLSLAGIAVMVGMPGTGVLHPTGVLLALASAVIYALYIPMIDHLGRGLPPAVTSVYATAGAAIVLFLVALATSQLSVQFAPVAWAAILVLALLSTVLAFLAFLRGLAIMGPVRTAIVSTVEPFWTALLGSVVLGQQIGPRTLVGGALIAAAVILLQLGQRAPVAAPPTA